MKNSLIVCLFLLTVVISSIVTYQVVKPNPVDSLDPVKEDEYKRQIELRENKIKELEFQASAIIAYTDSLVALVKEKDLKIKNSTKNYEKNIINITSYSTEQLDSLIWATRKKVLY